jgi:hypothetical protein
MLSSVARTPPRPLDGLTLLDMGKSFTEFRRRGFWARDTSLELWLRLVALHLRYRERIEDAAFRDLRETWLTATSGCQGCVGESADLNRVLSNDDLVRVALEASDEALKAIRRLGPKLDQKYLNALGLPGTFVADLDAWKVVQVGEHFIRLLRGELQWEVRSSPLLPAAEREGGSGGPAVA